MYINWPVTVDQAADRFRAVGLEWHAEQIPAARKDAQPFREGGPHRSAARRARSAHRRERCADADQGRLPPDAESAHRFQKLGGHFALIRRRVAGLDAGALGEIVVALVLVTLERESTAHHDDLRARLTQCPEVRQCYDLASDHDYAVIVATRGMSDLRETVDGLFVDAPNVKRFVTMRVYEVVKAGLEIRLR